VPCLVGYEATRGEPTLAIRGLNNCRESLVHRAFKNDILPNEAKIPRSGRPILLFKLLATNRDDNRLQFSVIWLGRVNLLL
jgi:hypothetical protein